MLASWRKEWVGGEEDWLEAASLSNRRARRRRVAGGGTPVSQLLAPLSTDNARVFQIRRGGLHLRGAVRAMLLLLLLRVLLLLLLLRVPPELPPPPPPLQPPPAC